VVVAFWSAIGTEAINPEEATRRRYLDALGGTVVEPNFVALIDPRSNSVVDTVQVGARPLGVAVGEGSVWVANQDDTTLSRIDAATHDLVRTITLDATPTGVAVGLGAVGCEAAPRVPNAGTVFPGAWEAQVRAWM